MIRESFAQGPWQWGGVSEIWGGDVTEDYTGETRRPLTVAMIGCGAVAELFHLPALARNPECHLELVVDKDKVRARQMARMFGARATADDYRQALGTVDAAVVALPHHLHEAVCLDLLRAGVHVLVEKPMALSADQCRMMTQAARDAGVVLAVGLIRRFLPSMPWVRDLIELGLFGAPKSFDVHEGGTLQLAVAFRLPPSARATSGGGVLFDTGAHTLDQILYWFGDPVRLDYSDDSYGGGGGGL